MPEPLLRVRDLSVDFKRSRGRVFRAVDHVSFDADEGHTLGIVGESGSGKSTIVHAVLGLIKPSEGSVCLEGRDIQALSPRERRAISGKLQVVFQDPYSSLNPSRRVGQIVAEPLVAQTDMEPKARLRLAGDMLERVGLDGRDLSRYPSSFSGGQRQRIAIARALITRPRIVVCDEPCSGLDLSAQAQVLNLLKDLQTEFGMALLFVSHDLAVVRYLASRILVLLHGSVVEEGPAASLSRLPNISTRRYFSRRPPCRTQPRSSGLAS